MKKISLDSQDKIKHPYQVSEDYFEGLEQRIMTRRLTSSQTHNFSWKWALAPAIILVIAMIFFFQIENQSNSNPEKLLAEIPENELLAYIDYLDLTTTELVKLSGHPEDLLDETDVLNEILMDDEDLEELMFEYELEDFNLTDTETTES